MSLIKNESNPVNKTYPARPINNYWIPVTEDLPPIGETVLVSGVIESVSRIFQGWIAERKQIKGSAENWKWFTPTWQEVVAVTVWAYCPERRPSSEFEPAKTAEKPEPILSKIEAIKDNARKEGVYMGLIFLEKKDYIEFINTPVVSRMIQALRLADTARRHIMWDGVQIVNNSLPLEVKEYFTGQSGCSEETAEKPCNHETFLFNDVQKKYLTATCLICNREISIFQILGNLQKRVKELENK